MVFDMSIAHFKLCQSTLIAACLVSFILPHVTNQNQWTPGRTGDIPADPNPGKRGEGAGFKEDLPGKRPSGYDRPPPLTCQPRETCPELSQKPR